MLAAPLDNEGRRQLEEILDDASTAPVPDDAEDRAVRAAQWNSAANRMSA